MRPVYIRHTMKGSAHMWLTVSQLAGLLSVTERAIQKAIADSRYIQVRQIEGRGRGRGGRAWQVSALDPAVPDEVREALGLKGDRWERVRAAKEAEKVGIAPERLDKRTAKRLRVLKRAAECPAGIPVGEWYARIAADEHVSVPTIYRWLMERKRGKVVSDRAPLAVALSFSSGPLEVAVKSRTFAPQALEYGLSLLANNPRMDVKRAYLETAEEAEKQGWEVGSLASFYRKWNEMPDAIRMLARGGRRGLELGVKPPIYRDYSKLKVYEILVGDQHIFDHTVLLDSGVPIRPQMFAWADFRSRYFSGICPVLGNYDKYAVGFALREACRWGIPDSLYTDWGRPERSDYVARIRRQLDGHAVLKEAEFPGLELGAELEHHKAKPRNAQAKPIESWFYNAVEAPMKQMGLPGYSRQDKKDEQVNEEIQKRLREEIKGGKLLRVQEFFEIFAKCLEDWHHHTMTEERIVPEECFLEGIQRPLTRIDDRTLEFLFWPAVVRQVRNSQVEITLPAFGKCRWYAPELSSYCGRGKGKKVEVRFNPYDKSVVHCLDLESHKLICTAEDWGKQDPQDMEAVVPLIREQNNLVKCWLNIFGQMKRPDIKVHRLTPYAGAAAEVQELAAVREELVVNDAELDRKIIALAESMGVGPTAQAK